MEMGVDRILNSIDYPFVDNQPGTDWIPTVPLSAEDKARILCGNVERLLRLLVPLSNASMTHYVGTVLVAGQLDMGLRSTVG